MTLFEEFNGTSFGLPSHISGLLHFEVTQVKLVKIKLFLRIFVLTFQYVGWLCKLTITGQMLFSVIYH